MKRLLLLVVGAFLISVTSAFAQVGNVPMYFNGGYQGSVWSGGPEGSVATGLYDGSINNVNVGPGQQSPGMICDDYYDNITTGEHWTATGYQVSALNASNIGNTLFGGLRANWSLLPGFSVGIAGALQGYAALAYLANDMFTHAVGNSALQSSISQAMWYLTSAAIGQPIGGLDSQALALVAQAEGAKNMSLSTYAGLFIYTQPFDPTGPQEMWGQIQVPEGGAALMYLLLGDVACFGAMFYSRRRTAMGGLA
jgi:hypothetical protein